MVQIKIIKIRTSIVQCSNMKKFLIFIFLIFSYKAYSHGGLYIPKLEHQLFLTFKILEHLETAIYMLKNHFNP